MPNLYFQPEILSFSNNMDHKDHTEKYLLGYGDGQISQSQIRWLNAEDEGIGISEVRDINYSLSFANEQLQVLVFLKADTASIPAQNALLKTLEEPPENVLIILTTSSIDNILPTITSRCNVIEISGDDNDSQQMENIGNLQASWQLITDTTSLAKLIDLAEQTKDRDQAVKLVRDLIVFLHNQRKDSDSVGQTTSLNNYTCANEALHQCLDQLNKNCNVRLALENCFFKINQIML